MKIIKRILAVFAVFILICVVGVSIWQWDNIKALYTVVTKDTDTIASDLIETKQKNEEKLKEYGVIVQSPSLEQTDALLNGTATSDDVKQSLNLNNSENAETSESIDTNTNSDNNSSYNSIQSQVQKIVNDCTSELYACQVDLMSELGGLLSSAKAEWIALGDGRNETTKQQFISEGLQQCYNLEASTDAKVQGILSTYRSKLEALNADTSVIDELWDMYGEEKNAQKSYYLSTYMD